MSEPFMFRDAPSQNKEEPSKAKAESIPIAKPATAGPVSTPRRRGSFDEDSDIVEAFVTFADIVTALNKLSPAARNLVMTALKKSQ